MPARLGRYVVLDELGAGGMGRVYAALDPELDRTVAIKVLHGRDHDAAARARLRREAQAMAKLQHPNVVVVFDVGEADGHTFVAMELVRGGSLRQWLATERDWRSVLARFRAAGHGLAGAHAQGLVHRDFKPDNVLIGDDGIARVTDFGLVRGLGGGAADQRTTLRSTIDPELTRRGAVVGTPAYMAPEQLEGLRLDARTDQFSFCVALWEGLYGRRPFDGDNLVALAAAIMRGQIREPPRRGVPAWLNRVVRRGLAIDPDRRWPTMDALLDALTRGPARRRRALAVIAAASVAGGAGWLAAHDDVAARCFAVGEEITGSWNGERAEQLTVTFVATALPSAGDTAADVRKLLDTWSAQWAGARREVCEATTRAGDVSDATLDRRVACLERKRRELEAILDVLAQADGQVVVRSIDAVRSIGAVAACDEEASSMIDPPPSHLRGDVEATERTLSAAKALLDTGRYTDGLALARQTVDAARAIGHAPLLARALHVLARLEVDSALVSDVEATTLYEALHTAELAGDDALAAEIAVQLLYDIGVGMGHLDRGRKWLPFAEAAVARVGSPPAVLARLHNARGGMLFWERRYDEALAAYEEVLRLRRQAFGDAAPETLQTLHNIALVQTEQGLPIEALANHRIALAADEQALGPDHPRVSYSLAHIGLLQQSLGDFAGALVTFRRELRIREQAFGLDNVKTVNVHRLIAHVLVALGRLDEADEHARGIIAAHERAGYEGLREPAGDGFLVLARTAALRGRTTEALAHRRASLRWFEAGTEADHPGLAEQLVELAQAEIDAGEHASALVHLRRALELEPRPDRPLRDPELWQRARELLDRARKHVVTDAAPRASDRPR